MSFMASRTVLLAAALAVASCLYARADTARIRQHGTRWILANSSVERVVETKPFLHTISLTNRMGDELRRHPIDSRGFLLWLDNDALRLGAADFRVGTPKTAEDAGVAQLVVPLSCEKHGLDVTVTYRLGPGEFYFRKHLVVDPGEHLLNKIDVESFRLGEMKLQTFDTQSMPFRMTPWNIPVGRPILAGGELFLGVEHPASHNTADDEGWISLRQHPGRKGKMASAPAVIGLCPDKPRQRLLDYFQRYVDENRARPVKRTIQWVAYFHAGMDDEFCRRKIAVAERVFRRRDAPIDVVLMDSGWTDPQSIMGISRQRPKRLELMAGLVKQRLGAELGLHVITSGVKRMVDKDWLAGQGYDMIYHKDKQQGAYCFADPRVLAEFRDNLVRYVGEYRIASYKFDWGHFECGQSGHRGHLPGTQYGFEAGAENFIRVQRALRKANPDIFLFNTGWYSPWWLWTYDACFSAGADYNFGLVGPPSFSTASLLCTWRDATIRGNLVQWSPFFPLNSLMTVDPISYWWHDWDTRAESPLRPLTDYYVTACLRGTQMTEIYNNIAAWDDAQADAVVAVLKWMKAHDDVILASTRYFGGDPLRGQPYGYAHFSGENRGIILIRNPHIRPQTITIPLDETTGMWPGKKQYVVRTVYPFTIVRAETVRYGSKCPQRLHGHEARVLEIWPLDALPEPMPIGCRYQVAARRPQRTTFRLGAIPEKLELFSPLAPAGGTAIGGGSRRYAVPLPQQPAGSASRRSDQTSRSAEPASVAAEDGNYVVSVDVPKRASARTALLFQQPGLAGEVTLDSKPVDADAPHLRLADATESRQQGLKRAGRTTGMRAKASDWSMFGVESGPGKHEIRFRPAVTTKPGGIAVMDFRSNARGEVTLSIDHGPITSREQVLLPQNWAWEVRQVHSLPLPAVDVQAKKPPAAK